MSTSKDLFSSSSSGSSDSDSEVEKSKEEKTSHSRKTCKETSLVRLLDLRHHPGRMVVAETAAWFRLEKRSMLV